MSENNRPETYAPHLPGGVIEVERLKELVDKLEGMGATKVKLTGEMIFVLGKRPLSETDKQCLPYPSSHFEVPGVRGIKVCSATTFCHRNHQDVLSLALRLDDLYYGLKLPMKLTIGLAGCARSCSEPATKDIGIIAEPKGFKILIGGSAGLHPSLGWEYALLGTPEEVIHLVGRVVEFCRVHGRKMIRLGRLVEEKGEDFFKAFLDQETTAGRQGLPVAVATETGDLRKVVASGL